MRNRLPGMLPVLLVILATSPGTALALGDGSRLNQPGARPSAKLPPLLPATGTEVRAAIAAERGKVVLVNVWATWCNPCKAEFPHLMRLVAAMRAAPFAVILVSADDRAHEPAARQFLASQGVDFPTFVKRGDDTAFVNAIEPRWSGSIPATFVFDRHGALAEAWEGAAPFERFVASVERVFRR